MRANFSPRQDKLAFPERWSRGHLRYLTFSVRFVTARICVGRFV